MSASSIIDAMGTGYDGGWNSSGFHAPNFNKCITPKAARALCLPALGLSAAYLLSSLFLVVFQQPILHRLTRDPEITFIFVFPFAQLFCGVVLMVSTGIAAGLLLTRSRAGGWTRRTARLPALLCAISLGAVAVLSYILPRLETAFYAMGGTSQLVAFSMLSNVAGWIAPLQNAATLLVLIAGAITWYQAAQDFGDYRWR